jgi:hypothetical protein
MQIEIETNANCIGSDLMVFNELAETQRIRAILADYQGRDMLHEVMGVYPGGEFKEAYATRVADSGEGAAYLIHGGAWGIRLRPEVFSKEHWDLTNPHQFGEPFKLYASQEDIRYS